MSRTTSPAVSPRTPNRDGETPREDGTSRQGAVKGQGSRIIRGGTGSSPAVGTDASQVGETLQHPSPDSIGSKIIIDRRSESGKTGDTNGGGEAEEPCAVCGRKIQLSQFICLGCVELEAAAESEVAQLADEESGTYADIDYARGFRPYDTDDSDAAADAYERAIYGGGR